MLNLVINARDAMTAKQLPGGTLTVSTATFHTVEPFQAFQQTVDPGRYVLLRVKDTGIGILDEHREHLFEPFFTTKEVGQGTGLGLATVYGIFRQIEGFVSVESTPGKGSTFTVGWPSGDLEPPATVSAPAEMTLAKGNGTVLLVEDADGVRRFTSTMLKHLGYTVLEASSGARALKIVADPSIEIDLLLSDMVMPNMGGKECAQAAVRLRPGLPILFMSGYSNEMVGTHDTGTIALLAKPFDRQQLAQAIQRTLNPND